MEITCKNHPDQVAKRRCYYCKQPICSQCQIPKSHHIFCSQACYRSYIINKISTDRPEQIVRLKQGLDWLWRKLELIPRQFVAIAILVVVLILSLVLNIVNLYHVQNLQRTINLFYQNQLPVNNKKNIADIAKDLDTLTILSPPAHAMIVNNKFDIEGQVDENRVITLSANGKLIQTTLVQSGKFAFKDLEAKPGTNHFVIRAITEDGSSMMIEEIEFKFGAPTMPFLARDYSRGNLDQKKIALTFDGDFLNNITAEILDILKQEHVTSTIFLTGRYIRRYGDLVVRMVQEGHEIGNHTWTHPHLTTYEQNHLHQTLPGMTKEILQQELIRTAELFRQLTGRAMAPYWRAPYGEHNAEIRGWAAEAGFRHIGWTVGKNWEYGMDTLDWVADKTATNYHSADEIVQKILDFGKDSPYGHNGAIILMHLGTQRSDDYPHLKLPIIIQQLKIKGYQLVTISELLQ